MASDLVAVGTDIGLPSQTVERLRAIERAISSGSAPELIDALLYTDAVLTVAREKRAAGVASEASRVRISAIRRLGELLRAAPEQEQEKTWSVLPTRFSRCEELADVPERLFKRAVSQLLEAESACSVAAVVRRAERESLQQVEPGILVAFNGTYWTKDKGKQPGSAQTKNLETARRRLGLKGNTHAVRLDEAYSTARIHASQLANLGQKMPSEVRSLVGEAELAQMRVAELLDRAIRQLTGVTR